MFLPNDICRCHDRKCGVRFTCGRFIDNVDKSEEGASVVCAPTLKDEEDDEDLPCDWYIECSIMVDLDE